jgi:putative peptide zinc metalloprotease protein
VATVCGVAAPGTIAPMLRRRVLASFAVVLATVCLVALPAGADVVVGAGGGDDGGNNHVTGVNRQDGLQRSKGRVAIAEEGGATVDDENRAIAFASCTDCRTVAAAIEVVVVEGEVHDFRPANVAAAVNVECLRCMTFAYAKQVVLTPYQPVTIGADALERIKAVDRRVDELIATGGVAFDDLRAQLDVLAGEVVAIVQGEIDRSTAATAGVASSLVSSDGAAS